MQSLIFLEIKTCQWYKVINNGENNFKSVKNLHSN